MEILDIGVVSIVLFFLILILLELTEDKLHSKVKNVKPYCELSAICSYYQVKYGLESRRK